MIATNLEQALAKSTYSDTLALFYAKKRAPLASALSNTEAGAAIA